ncbi:hypothetical protein PQO03_19110 [Lentisphaera profundi]|uniref:Lipoprotein n=1 Tax=Lentisphaera profundi TaxID=1658616 RepID=A0ABY7VVY4_9BACT|nr:hypothetical protein [Lentisphaera profundi]WDE97939.1 hypothetical protein PQO03_19110 [Lentisphaera profundi]
MKLGKLSLVLLLSFTLFSCLIYKQEINIFSDGSASLNISYSIDKKTLKSLEDFNKVAKNASTKETIQYFDELAIESYLDSFKEIKSHSVRVYADKTRVYTEIKADISNLRTALNAGLIPYAHLSKNEGNWLFSYSTPYDFKTIKDKKALERLSQVEIDFTINTPSKIITSSNKNFTDKKVRWKFSPKSPQQAHSIPQSFFVEFSGDKISFD